MAKYKKKPEAIEGDGGGAKAEEQQQEALEIKVRWSSVGREASVWPKTTTVTESNLEALLKLVDPGKDVLEVKLG